MGPRVPLGFLRLRVVQFCVPLFFTNRTCIDEALAESALLPVILDLFFQYEWNNFLHQKVESLLASLYDGSSQPLRHAVVLKCHLPSRLAAAVDASEQRFAAQGLRAGNHAFLLLLGETIVAACEEDEALAALCAKEEGWQALVDGPLAESRAFEGHGALPEASSSSSMDEEEAARGQPGFQFGGWQDALESDSSEEPASFEDDATAAAEGEEGAEADEGLDPQAQAALEELRQLALAQQSNPAAEEEEEEADDEKKEEKEEEKKEEEDANDDTVTNDNGAENNDDTDGGNEDKKEPEAAADDEDKTQEEEVAEKKEDGEPTTPTKLTREDTPFSAVQGERFKEVGNQYGTPPPATKLPHDQAN